jgi:P-type Ca2+ transporter type 2C
MMRVDSSRLTAPARVGLSNAEAAARLRRDGPNETKQLARRHIAGRVTTQLLDPLIMLLLAAASVTAATGDITDTIVILLVIAVNTAIGVTQEARADRAIAALRSLGAPTCRVVRDGIDQVIPAADVVVGDLVRLAAGDIVAADIRVAEATRLRVNESAVTGESLPVPIDAGGEALAGTAVTDGRGIGVVTRVGAQSTLGRIVTLTEQSRGGPTPLQRRLARLGRALATWTVVLSALVAVIGIIQGRPALEMAIVGVSLVVAAVPESLPAVVTLALALGARRMAAARALTRRLTAVEALGSVTVLVSDKTGTLTQGTMAVRTAVTAGGSVYDVDGAGYTPDGTVVDRADHRTGPDGDLRELARAAVLCNDADLVRPGTDDHAWTVAGEHIEGALVAFAWRAGLDVEAERAGAPRTAEEPFDQQSQMMMTEHLAGSDLVRVYKGAPEVLLGSDLIDVREPVPELLRAAADLARSGLRVLAVAAGPPGAIRPLGVVGIGDPARPEAAAAVRALVDAGVRTVMVTGDHPETARAIADDVGIWQPGSQAITCAGGHPEVSPDVRVIARARPDDKLAIVGALKAAGEVVAVTGDGVNDAPALRRADIGVAMGSGTEVARQAAQLVLADDNLGTLDRAVAEGRRVYANIRRFLRYALAGGVGELLTMLIGPAVGLATALLPAQILWINLLTHGLPGVAMGAEPASPDAMRRRPRSPEESVLGSGLGIAVLWTGALIAACATGVGVGAHAAGLPWQTMLFLTLGLAQLGVAIAVRAPRRPGHGNRWLALAVASSVALLFAGVYVAPLQELLGTSALDLTPVLVAAAVSTVPGLAVGVTRRFGRRL